MSEHHLVLAGGGHTHALLLLRWGMHPHLRPKGLITLVNRSSSTLYSGMIPGLIAGEYSLKDVIIDLRYLSAKAGVALVIDEITKININNNLLELSIHSPIFYTIISFDVGSETVHNQSTLLLNKSELSTPIRPLEKSLNWLKKEDQKSQTNKSKPFTIVGSGLSGLEVSFALRKRWPGRKIQLQTFTGKLKRSFRRALLNAKIDVINTDMNITGPALFCTGNRAPAWLRESGLLLDTSSERILTKQTLQVVDFDNIFAVGDCAVINKFYRPSSGVWAVRAAAPLAHNLESFIKGSKLIHWSPQKRALQLICGLNKENNFVAWALWGGVLIGPNFFLWRLKQLIDKGFIERFIFNPHFQQNDGGMKMNLACRGCAAKLPEEPLKSALKKADLSCLGTQPEDAALIASLNGNSSIFQSVDGFPALVSDPWLNGRLTTLHACSDIWASGASVISAQAGICLPDISSNIQTELLAQCLGGIKSALDEQGAKLLGGHSFESRSLPPAPSSLGIEITISVNGLLDNNQFHWQKGGLEKDDLILLSRSLGSGVLFAADMENACLAEDLDNALDQLSTSQHILMNSIFKLQNKYPNRRIIHSSTDITGFGLLGHLGEMVKATNIRRKHSGLSPIQIQLETEMIPSFKGVIDLIKAGYCSTLAPENRKFWRFLERSKYSEPLFKICSQKNNLTNAYLDIIKEIIIDPQTCGPLLISCSSDIALDLLRENKWHVIGSVNTIQ